MVNLANLTTWWVSELIWLPTDATGNKGTMHRLRTLEVKLHNTWQVKNSDKQQICNQKLRVWTITGDSDKHIHCLWFSFLIWKMGLKTVPIHKLEDYITVHIKQSVEYLIYGKLLVKLFILYDNNEVEGSFSYVFSGLKDWHIRSIRSKNFLFCFIF